jgi:pheromone shutdown protein TraB
MSTNEDAQGPISKHMKEKLKFVALTGEFPTRCESIIEKRDPIFFRRMISFFAGGKALAFVGVGHIPGIIQMFRDESYSISREAR